MENRKSQQKARKVAKQRKWQRRAKKAQKSKKSLKSTHKLKINTWLAKEFNQLCVHTLPL
jgi:hypothetical protein